MPADSIEQAIDQTATEMVKSASEGQRSVEKLSIEELIKADQYKKGTDATKKSHFGMSIVRLVPPGTG